MAADEADGDVGMDYAAAALELQNPLEAFHPGGDALGFNSSGRPNLAPEDPGLGSVSLPALAIKRIAKSAAPEARFSPEAIAALHRVAQVFVCYATDRALGAVQADKDKAKKVKGKTLNTIARPTLGTEHVMKFLSADLPQVASKVSSLFPELVPTEFKPPGIVLLEELDRQRMRNAAFPQSGAANTIAEQQRAAPPPAEAELERPTSPLAVNSSEVASKGQSLKRPADGGAKQPAKKGRAATVKATETKPVALTSFFGAVAKHTSSVGAVKATPTNTAEEAEPAPAPAEAELEETLVAGIAPMSEELFLAGSNPISEGLLVGETSVFSGKSLHDELSAIPEAVAA